MSLQARIGERVRELREAKKLTQEALAGLAQSDPATLSRIESGKRNIGSETLASLLIALKVSPKDFFDTAGFGELLSANVDDPESINSEHFSLEEVGGSVRVHFPCGRHEATLDFRGLTRQKVGNAVLLLRRGLRQAELTPQVSEEESGSDAPAATALMSAGIAESFLSLVQGSTALNPSDVWRYIIYRAFCDPQNHPASSFRKNLTESFKRTSGWAFERILAAHYGPFLDKQGVVLTKVGAGRLLDAMGLPGKISVDKIDLFIAAKDRDNLKPLGVVHLKSSLAERRTDDVPASQLVIQNGYLSLFVTLDGKDTPSSNPVNRGEYGPTLAYDEKTRQWRGSQKRKDIELEGLFSAVFSYNARTIESPEKTKSGCRIVRANFANPDDSFSRFILQARDRLMRRAKKK